MIWLIVFRIARLVWLRCDGRGWRDSITTRGVLARRVI